MNLIIILCTALLASIGIGLILADILRVPTYAVSRATHNLGKRQNRKTNPLEIWMRDLSNRIAERLKLNEYKRMQLDADLKTAEGYIDVAVTVMIVAFVLVFAVNMVSLVALNQNVKTVADQLTEYAAMKGMTDIGSYAEDLKEKTGIDFAYSFAGSTTMDSSGKVQLGEQIVCTVIFRSSIVGFGDVIHPMEIKASSSGLSQVYEDGAFIQKKYGIRVSDISPRIAPGSTCKTAVYENGGWVMRSGYGITMNYSPVLTTLPGCNTPLGSDITNIQTVYATFPEYGYSTDAESFRTLCFTDGCWCFVPNIHAAGNEPLHYIPVWFGDGQYTVAVTITDIWTPAGMITAVRTSNLITISGNLFDDYYIGT